MDFKDELKQLAERVVKLKERIQTEEATKNAFIMPFIQCLGYDVFNPLEVVPEYVADIGIKKGEKVDYAILKDDKPAILIECKWWGENLDLHNTQLFRYFTATNAKFALLTNGINFKFYSDIVETNKMDEKPFLDFDITSIKDGVIEELKKFHKSYFNIEEIVNSASELKYANEIKALMSNELKTPSENFVRFIVGQIYPGRATEKVITQFTEIIRKSLTQLVNDIVNEKIKSALDKENEPKSDNISVVENVAEQNLSKDENENKIETTEIELEGFYTIKSILRTKFDANRITYKDTQNYFGILLDDNTRKTICRLWFNGVKKYIGLFDANKNETKYEIKAIDDIYKYSEQLFQIVMHYDSGQINRPVQQAEPTN